MLPTAGHGVSRKALTSVCYRQQATGAGIEHGDDSGNKNASCQVTTEDKADDGRQAHLTYYNRVRVRVSDYQGGNAKLVERRTS